MSLPNKFALTALLAGRAAGTKSLITSGDRARSIARYESGYAINARSSQLVERPNRQHTAKAEVFSVLR